MRRYWAYKRYRQRGNRVADKPQTSPKTMLFFKFCGLVAAASSALIAGAQLYQMQQQTEQAAINNSIQKELKDITARQLAFEQMNLNFQNNQATPIIQYVREPEVQYTLPRVQERGPKRGDMIHTYPERSYFSVAMGVTALRYPTSIYTGSIRYSKECPFKRDRNNNVSIRVSFDSWVVNKGLIYTNGSLKINLEDKNSTSFLDVIVPGIEERISGIEKTVSDQVKGCVGDTRIYGDYIVSHIDARSEEHLSYFSGYLKGKVNIATERDYQLVSRAKEGVFKCTFGNKPEQIKNCVDYIKTTFEN